MKSYPRDRSNIYQTQHIDPYIHNKAHTLHYLHTKDNCRFLAHNYYMDYHKDLSMLYCFDIPSTGQPHTSAHLHAKRTPTQATRAQAACHTHHARLYQEFDKMYYGNKCFYLRVLAPDVEVPGSARALRETGRSYY